jgi:hypothetical protein
MPNIHLILCGERWKCSSPRWSKPKQIVQMLFTAEVDWDLGICCLQIKIMWQWSNKNLISFNCISQFTFYNESNLNEAQKFSLMIITLCTLRIWQNQMQRFTAVTKAFSVTEMDGAVNIEKSTRHASIWGNFD